MDEYKEGTALLEWMATCAKRHFISDLKNLTPPEALELSNLIKDHVKPEDVPLSQWNDALDYLLHETPKDTREAAKAALLAGMRQK